MLQTRKTLNSITHTCFILFILCCTFKPEIVYSAVVDLYHDNGNSDFTLIDQHGNKQSLADYRGKVVLINFWASWCPPCIYEMPELTRLKNKLSDQAFEILTINVGEKKYRVRKFTKLINFNLPVLLDTSSEIFDNYGVKTLPTSFLADANGNIIYRIRGNPGWDQDETIQMIKKLISGNADPAQSITNQ